MAGPHHLAPNPEQQTEEGDGSETADSGLRIMGDHLPEAVGVPHKPLGAGMNGTRRAPQHVEEEKEGEGGATAAANAAAAASLERREEEGPDDDDDAGWQMSGWPGQPQHQLGGERQQQGQHGEGDDPPSPPDDASRQSTSPPGNAYPAAAGGAAAASSAATSELRRRKQETKQRQEQPRERQHEEREQQRKHQPGEPIFTASGFADPPKPSAQPHPGQRHQQLGTVGLFSGSVTGRTLTLISDRLIPPRVRPTHSGSALAGFLSLLLVTCANYVLSPMRDAAALAVGVSHIPALTLASTVLALASSVPVGWLFEAPNPARRGRLLSRVGLTRGETQGTSLALFYRCFAMSLVGYAVGFKVVEIIGATGGDGVDGGEASESGGGASEEGECPAGSDSVAGECLAALSLASLLSARTFVSLLRRALTRIVKSKFGKLFYVAFFLVVHLMKLHSLSLIWGVTSEAMEYEEQAERRERQKLEEEQAEAAQAGKQQKQGQEQGRKQRRRYSAPYGTGGVHHKHQPVLRSIPSGEVAPSEPQHDEQQRHAGASGGVASALSPSAAVPTSAPSGSAASSAPASPPGSRSRARLKRLSFVGFGGTLGGILGSVIASAMARTLHLSGLLVVAAIMLELSAELSIELGKIMLRHWQEEQLWAVRIRSCSDLVGLGSGSGRRSSLSSLAEERSGGNDDVDSSMKRVASLGSMKRVASGNSLSGMRRARSAASLGSVGGGEGSTASARRDHSKSMGSLSDAVGGGGTEAKGEGRPSGKEAGEKKERQQPIAAFDDNSFSQRLLRGVTTILRSRLLMCIFTYNALAATTSVLLSFQRAELVANRSAEGTSAERDTAFLANVNMASSVAVFALQASGLGAFIASSCGQYGTLVLMPMIRLCGVLMLAWWHVKGAGRPPNLTLFLFLDEFTKVINFAVAKPVRESLWRGLSAEARYEAKPIVDTLANRWGGGSAAFLTSAIGRIMDSTGAGRVPDDGTKTLFGFPPILILCTVAAIWWAVVSADLGSIRRRIDIELKKHL